METPNQELSKKDFVSDQDVRWCPGCGDYAILSQVQKIFPSLGIPKEQFLAYHKFHSLRISLIAMPLMIIELITSFLLLYQNFNNVIQKIFLINLVLVVLIWLSTFLVQVPLHNILSKEKNDKVISKLILSNWFRTILWTARSILMILFLSFTMGLI